MAEKYEYVFKPFSSFKVGDSVSFTNEFSAEDVRQFSELTGDLNPIHLDEEFAKTTFCGTASINMGQEWGCPAPTRVGDSVTYEVTVKEMVEEKHDLILELKGTRQDGTVVFTGTNRVKIMDKKKNH